eukprot:TCONS_00041108-protein
MLSCMALKVQRTLGERKRESRKMAKRRGNKDAFAAFEMEQSTKRTGKKTESPAPKDLTVQVMSSATNPRNKKYEVQDVKRFVPFNEFYELTLENIKAACEAYYQMPAGTCDVLVTNSGPSVQRTDQIKGKKSFLVRFTDEQFNSRNLNVNRVSSGTREFPVEDQQDDVEASAPIPPPAIPPPPPKSQFAKSVSIATLLKAGKLKKPKKIEKITLEYYSLEIDEWVKMKDMSLEIEDKSFGEGAFRKAFKAVDCDTKKEWVVKKYLQSSKKTMKFLNTTVTEHARKQCQMHSVARNIAQRMAKKAKELKDVKFGDIFVYERVYFGLLNGEPVTLEEFIPGFFLKYVNNDGNCFPNHTEEAAFIYQKAQTLVHFSIHISDGKIILTDIQGSIFKLYDPEISTLVHQDEDSEFYFCSGNLSLIAFQRFRKEHKCNEYCRMLGMKEIEPMDEPTDENESSEKSWENQEKDLQ